MVKTKEKTIAKIEFQQNGIGAVLEQNRLTVPINQREYSWEEEHVKELLQDLAGAFGGDSYFLGTIVLTRTNDKLEIADGQQRLATTSILFAAMRDWMLENNTIEGRASALEQRLLTYDGDTGETVARLNLNLDDNDYFLNSIIKRQAHRPAGIEPTKASHRRLQAAAILARAHVEAIVAPLRENDRWKTLTEWARFLQDQVQVIVLTVPDYLDAFAMFETLNDRGLKASQADMIKNYLLSQSGDRIDEVQKQWAHMLGVLDATGVPDLALTYMRHFVICNDGPTKERELLKKVKAMVDSPASAARFAKTIADNSNKYASLFNPDHPNWNDFAGSGRRLVRTMNELEVEQIRPLMFAVLKEFTTKEAKEAFRLFVVWSVRFLISGGGRGGLLERHYALKAQAVSKGEIGTAKALSKSMVDVIPPDVLFQTAFTEARVSRSTLAKYYLRAMELFIKGADPEPHFVLNDDESINLEHILPENPGPGWGHVPQELAEAYYRRIGNMVLMQAKKNVKIGNGPFKEKKAVFKDSPYLLTKDVASEINWGPSHIVARQKRLAEIAVKTWPL